MNFVQISRSCLAVVLASSLLHSQVRTPTRPPSSSSKHNKRPASSDPSPDAGELSNGIYRNKTFGFSCTIPPGWVLRTEEMNAREESAAPESQATPDRTAESGKVLLAAFLRPPDARAEDVNSSILIAAESMAAYPGLKEAAQYFGPVSEVAKAQGFQVAEEPYPFALGTKSLARADFQKNVGTRVMRQSTLVMLSHGYAVSFTFIGGTDEEIEELIAGLSLGASSATR